MHILDRVSEHEPPLHSLPHTMGQRPHNLDVILGVTQVNFTARTY